MRAETAAAPPPKGRLIAGVGVFALGWVVTLAVVPLVSATSLSTSAQATLTAILVFVGPKFGVLGAIAIMGKPGFTYLRRLVFGYLKPPAEVSRARYRIGIVMFVISPLLGLLERHVDVFTPGENTLGLSYSVGVDLLLVASLFVLGGDFWDKLRALFIYEAKAQFPAKG